jgi:hypothetical protein
LLSPIAYPELIRSAAFAGAGAPSPELLSALEDAWLSAYWAACTHESNVLKFEDAGFLFLFDQTSATGSVTEDRLVAGYGVSSSPNKGRDAGRMRGFLGGRLEIPGKGVFDKGHVLAHGMGGGLDANLFPQRPELNRGRSPAGKIYRRMERYAATHPGTFAFSRLWYSDSSWVPSALEYGILMPEGQFWVEQFAN